jgi:hypothetical protein
MLDGGDNNLGGNNMTKSETTELHVTEKICAPLALLPDSIKTWAYAVDRELENDEQHLVLGEVTYIVKVRSTSSFIEIHGPANRLFLLPRVLRLESGGKLA